MPAILNGVEYQTLNAAVCAAKDGDVIECKGATTVIDEAEIDVRVGEPLPMILACKVKCNGTPQGIRWKTIG
jgi:hypothetical protein